MNNRRSTQQAHERAQVAAFLRYLNKRHRASFETISEPNPPEAIIRSGRTTRWVEVTDAFLDDDFARDEVSYATPGEIHRPTKKTFYVGPDEQYAERFVDVVRKKLEKRSYISFANKYGPGYLIVPLLNPLFTASSMPYLVEAYKAATIADLRCFRSIYIRPMMGRGEFIRWNAYKGT
jgi:hypothetical protein